MKISNKLIKKIIQEETQKKEMDEDILDPLRNVWAGVRGTFKGEGYEYFNYLSQIKNLSRDLKRLDKPNHNIIKKLQKINDELQNSKMNQTKKQNIKKVIDGAIHHFNQYTSYIDAVENAINTKLS